MKNTVRLLKSLETLQEKRYFTLTVPQQGGDDRQVRFDIAKELRITDADLDQQMSDQPQQMFFWGNIKISMLSRVRKAEQDYAETYNKYYLAYRQHLIGKGPTMTEPWLRAEAEGEVEVQKARALWNDALDQLGLISSIVDALDHRRSMLIQRASRSRL